MSIPPLASSLSLFLSLFLSPQSLSFDLIAVSKQQLKRSPSQSCVLWCIDLSFAFFWATKEAEDRCLQSSSSVSQRRSFAHEQSSNSYHPWFPLSLALVLIGSSVTQQKRSFSTSCIVWCLDFSFEFLLGNENANSRRLCFTGLAFQFREVYLQRPRLVFILICVSLFVFLPFSLSPFLPYSLFPTLSLAWVLVTFFKQQRKP